MTMGIAVSVLEERFRDLAYHKASDETCSASECMLATLTLQKNLKLDKGSCTPSRNESEEESQRGTSGRFRTETVRMHMLRATATESI